MDTEATLLSLTELHRLAVNRISKMYASGTPVHLTESRRMTLDGLFREYAVVLPRDDVLHQCLMPSVLQGDQDYQAHYLLLCVCWKRDDLLLLALQAGINPNHYVRFLRKSTALHEAVRSLNVKMVNDLIQFGADANALDGGGWTPMMHVMHSYPMTMLLLRHGGKAIPLLYDDNLQHRWIQRVQCLVQLCIYRKRSDPKMPLPIELIRMLKAFIVDEKVPRVNRILL